MTKKRFIKLLMARGMPRNTAQRLARMCNRSGISYIFMFSVYKGVRFISKV
jgi:hypothetical protein